ncbi:hypothetical protein [Lysinibacillus sp. Bpr_S20]|uniref:hypothetical protein n=1 Tax=Lysinibacillus sp. Bpr_S20 TaxID=2933964 RepID=UPI002012A1F2|nr:hypothetical protein [Lysinibacillus sp. Bpr_S20]MCL1700819.1 hypothetical protein [Lysinibacillus sp. Bpr_S20]
MNGITVKIVNETACLMLMHDNEMLDCLFINKYFFDTLSPDEHKTIANVYKETYNVTQCLVTAKEKTEHTIDLLQFILV